MDRPRRVLAVIAASLTALAALLVPMSSAQAASIADPVTCKNADGRLEQFYLEDHPWPTPFSIGHRWETRPGGGYTNSGSLGGKTTQNYPLACARNVTGNMHVFVVGEDFQVKVKWQTRANDSTSYTTTWDGRLGAPNPGTHDVLSNVAAVYDGSGLIEIFVISCDNISVCEMYTKWQTQNGGWSGWAPMGGNFVNAEVAAGTYGTYGASVAGVGMDLKPWCDLRTTAHGPWSGWYRC
jgi:hypothetical protein